MTKEDVLKVVSAGDCYRIKTTHEEEPFNFYVSKIGAYALEQSGTGLDIKFVSYKSVEKIEAY